MVEYYTFFKDEMPFATFLTDSKEEAVKLYCKINRQSWEVATKNGISVIKELDVMPEKWQKICDKFTKMEKAPPIPILKPSVTKLKPMRSIMPEVVLETAKYLRKF